VRVDVVSGALPADLQVDLVDPGSSPADAAVGASDPISTAQAAQPLPNLITRAQWGADESLRNGGPYYNRTVKVVFVHHTDTTNNYTRAEAPAIIRSVYAYHTQTLGWSDIAYNFLVDRFGRIYEGRAGGVSLPIRSAATGGFNTDTASISALGTFTTTTPSRAMVSSIARIAAYKLSLYDRNPLGYKTLIADHATGTGSRYSNGDRARFAVISGHRDAGYTTCPGGRLYNKLPKIRGKVLADMGANLVEPSLHNAVVPVATPALVKLHSRVLTRQRWKLTISRICGTQPTRTVTGRAGPANPIGFRWDGRNDAGTMAQAGVYELHLTSWNAGSSAISFTRRVVLHVGSDSTATVTGTAPQRVPGRYFPLHPTTLVNSSTGLGLDHPVVLGAGDKLKVPVLGAAGVPASGVSAVALSVTARCPTARGAIDVWPTNTPATGGRSVELRPHRTTQGTVVVAPGDGGAVTVANHAGLTAVAIAVVGYYTSDTTKGSGLVPVAPTRVYGAATTLPVGQTISVDASGVPGWSSNAHAVVVNVHRFSGGSGGRLTLWAPGTAKPSVATVSFGDGGQSARRVVVPIAANGTFNAVVDRAGNALAFDVSGFMTSDPASSDLHPVVPHRLKAASTKLSAGSAVRVAVGGHHNVPPNGVTAVLLQVVAGRPTRHTSLTAWPAGSPRPSLPDVSTGRHTSANNLVVVPLGSNGSVRIYNARGTTHLRVDVVGWYG
jgi:hypothetical protein